MEFVKLDFIVQVAPRAGDQLHIIALPDSTVQHKVHYQLVYHLDTIRICLTKVLISTAQLAISFLKEALHTLATSVQQAITALKKLNILLNIHVNQVIISL